MEGTVQEFLSIVVAAVLAAALLGAIVGLANQGQEVFGQVNESIQTREMLKEYRAFNEYDGTTVKGAKVIAFIMANMYGDVGTEVVPISGAAMRFTGRLSGGLFEPITDASGELDEKANPSKYELTELQDKISANATYQCTLLRSTNDTVAVVRFTQQP